jgi:uncharacterized protein with FMN-binding domain
MKRLFAFTTSLVLVSGGLAFAQNKPVGPTPTIYTVKPTLHGVSNGKASSTSPNMHSVNLQVRAQIQQIQKDLKSGKLTKDSAKDAFSKLKAIRQQELIFFRENGQKEITDDQKSQLTTLLNNNANSI